MTTWDGNKAINNKSIICLSIIINMNGKISVYEKYPLDITNVVIMKVITL